MSNPVPVGNSADSASRAQILRATLWAAVAAAVIVVAVVLPAEYGIDPTGFGRLTGLGALAATRVAPTAAAPAAAAGSAAVAGGVAPLTVWVAPHSDKYHMQSYEITMQGDEEFEYKADMKRGDALLYSWHVKQGSNIYYEFHGEPSEGQWPKDFFESYEKGESSGRQGSMVAPFTGHHGWYWLNLSEKPVTIIVELAGYYGQFGKMGPPPQPAGK